MSIPPSAPLAGHGIEMRTAQDLELGLCRINRFLQKVTGLADCFSLHSTGFLVGRPIPAPDLGTAELGGRAHRAKPADFELRVVLVER
jgi:hypothetical protein